MEAMKALFLPLTQKVKQVMESGKIGDILYMDGKYSYKSDLNGSLFDWCRTWRC